MTSPLCPTGIFANWLVDRVGARPLGELLQYRRINRDWRKFFRDSPVYAEIAGDIRRLQISPGKPSRTVARYPVRGADRTVYWEKESEAGRREAGGWKDIGVCSYDYRPPDFLAAYQAVAFDPLRLEPAAPRQVTQDATIPEEMQALLVEHATRTPAAVSLWETLWGAMNSGHSHMIQVDWPVFYRRSDWDRDTGIIHCIAEFYNPVSKGPWYGYLLVTNAPSPTLSFDDHERRKSQMAEEECYWEFQKFHLDEFLQDEAFDAIRALGQNLRPWEHPSLRIMFVRKTVADSLFQKDFENYNAAVASRSRNARWSIFDFRYTSGFRLGSFPKGWLVPDTVEEVDGRLLLRFGAATYDATDPGPMRLV